MNIKLEFNLIFWVIRHPPFSKKPQQYDAMIVFVVSIQLGDILACIKPFV